MSAAGREIKDDDVLWDRVANLHSRLIILAWRKQGRQINLASPKSLGEKIEWLKLNYHKELLIQLTDKLAVREYVSEKLGNNDLLSRVYGVYTSTDEIDFSILPESGFVIKTNRRSGDLLIQTESNRITRTQLKHIEKLLHRKYGTNKAEWPYWHIPPKLFVEEYLQDKCGQLIDYKVFCFNGDAKLIRVGKRGHTDVQRVSYFDLNWNLMPFRNYKAPNLKEGNRFPCPSTLEEMLRCARVLSDGLPFARVDFYDIDGHLKFGELTLYHESGLNSNFTPAQWNWRCGEWLALPDPIRNPKLAYGAAI